MFTRTTGIVIVPIWLATMGWLFAHDVWPVWTAKEPPLVQPSDWIQGEGRQVRFSLVKDGQVVGAIWRSYTPGNRTVQRVDTIWVERLSLPVVPLYVRVDSTFTEAGLLDDFKATIEPPGMLPVELHGERFYTDFSFEFKQGPVEHVFKVPLTDGGIIGSALSPLSQLTDIHVGQTWRMQVFNPMAALVGVGDRFVSVVVEVTAREKISTDDGEVDCFVVESPGTRAWIDERGTVLVQEATLPMVGKFSLVRESDYDEMGLAEVRRRRMNYPPE